MSQMSGVVQALYDKEFQAIGAILAREADLRGKLNKLDEQIAQNRDVCANSHEMQAVGAQLLWQGWTTRMRRQLNTELAQVIVTKLAAMERVRKAFGRKQAVEMMMSAEQRRIRTRRNKKRDASLQII